MQLQELDDLTVVILTYNRHHYLAKVIEFWAEYSVKVVVVDGSEKRFDGFLGNERTIYIHRPESIYARMKEAVDMIETPFVIQACDDELYCPPALASAVRFLRTDGRYVSCLGEAVGLRLEDGDVAWAPIYEALRHGKTFEEDPSIRAICHLTDYRFPAHFYAVNRTEAWRTVWRNLLKKEYPPVTELQLELALEFAGNVKVISEVMWVRNLFEPPVGGHIARQQSVKVWDWWDSEENTAEKAAFVEEMSELLTSLSGENQDGVKHEVHRVTALAFEAYVKTWRLGNNEASATGSRFRGIFRRIFKRVLKFFLPRKVWESLSPPPALISDCVGPEATYDEALFADIGRRLVSARLGS